jgi:hypothetical protein
MGNSIVVLCVFGSLIGIGAIVFGIYIAAALYQCNRLDARLKCTCGKRALLYNNTKVENKTAYAYMCDCGVIGYIGLSKEEALYGWELRGNRSAYMDYIISKQMKISGT